MNKKYFILNSCISHLVLARIAAIKLIKNFMNDDVGNSVKEVYELIKKRHYKKAQEVFNIEFPSMKFLILKRGLKP